MRKLSCVRLALPLIAAAGAIGAGQEPSLQPTFRSGATLVTVDAYVSLNGAPVTDLRPEEFEVFEDGTRQTITEFEMVTIDESRARPPAREPDSVAESWDRLADSRTRVFVLFLDARHVAPELSRAISPALLEFLREMIGPDDLVAVMTADTSAADLVFGRRTLLTERLLEDRWWGTRRTVDGMDDPVEFTYQWCYPPSVAGPMIRLRREELVLAAFEDLVEVLGRVRTERTTVVTVTQGWAFQRADLTFATEEAGLAGKPRIGVDPRTGRLGTLDPQTGSSDSVRRDCERDRMRLAAANHEQRFETFLRSAARTNVAFYPVDPRRFPVSAGGVDVLHRLAEATDGRAIVNTNQVAGRLRQAVAELSSYYLLGYRSTNDREDGTVRQLRVRVTRPGVEVLDRTGTPLSVPVSAARVDAADGEAWHTVDIAAASLAAADYLLELVEEDTGAREVIGFRVVP